MGDPARAREVDFDGERRSDKVLTGQTGTPIVIVSKECVRVRSVLCGLIWIDLFRVIIGFQSRAAMIDASEFFILIEYEGRIIFFYKNVPII